MNETTEIEQSPTDDEEFEDFGPDDLELIGGYSMETEENEYEEWPEDPLETIRKEEEQQWLRELVDPDERSVRVVGLGRFVAAVFEEDTLTIVQREQREPMTYFDPDPYSDEELRQKIRSYLTFL